MSRSISPLLTFLLELEDLHAPFMEYLERELTAYPLTRLPLPVTDFLTCPEKTLQADAGAMQALLRRVDSLGYAEGLGDVFGGWGEAYGWLLEGSFNPDL